MNPPFLPRFSRGQRSPGVTKGGTLYYPYWLAYACGWAQKSGFQVHLFDFVASGDGFTVAVNKIQKQKPDLVVIETSTPSIYSDIKFAQKLKSKTNALVVLVGTHVSSLSKETLRSASRRTQGKIDAVTVGEYDQTIVDLAKALAKNQALTKVRGLVYWQKGRIVSNSPRELLKGLDDFPFVSQIYKKFLSPKDYYFAAADWPMVMLVSGRGCPFGCFFCLWPQTLHGLRYRTRSPKNLAAEFAYISQNMPEIREVVIEDDTFTTYIDRVKEFCRLLIKQKNQLKWSTNARVSLDLPTMKLMKRAGCRLLIAGYESGNQKVLEGMDKKIKLSQSLRFAENAQKACLLVHGCFMVGNPGETLETMHQTLDFAKRLFPDSAQFYPLFVYPGTRAYDWAKTKGYLKAKDFRGWINAKGAHQCVIDLPGLSAQEMVSFCNHAYWEYHLQPKYLVKKLGQLILNPSEGRRSLRSAWRYFKGILNL